MSFFSFLSLIEKEYSLFDSEPYWYEVLLNSNFVSFSRLSKKSKIIPLPPFENTGILLTIEKSNTSFLLLSIHSFSVNESEFESVPVTK